MDFFYDGQIRRYVTQFMRIFIGFKYEAGNGDQQSVPVMYGDLTRQVANIIRENSNGLVMTISIKDWEINDLKNNVYNLEFQYRQYTEKLSIFDATKGGL